MKPGRKWNVSVAKSVTFIRHKSKSKPKPKPKPKPLRKPDVEPEPLFEEPLDEDITMAKAKTTAPDDDVEVAATAVVTPLDVSDDPVALLSDAIQFLNWQSINNAGIPPRIILQLQQVLTLITPTGPIG